MKLAASTKEDRGSGEEEEAVETDKMKPEAADSSDDDLVFEDAKFVPPKTRAVLAPVSQLEKKRRHQSVVGWCMTDDADPDGEWLIDQEFEVGSWYRVDKVLEVAKEMVHVLAMKSAVNQQVDDLSVWIDDLTGWTSSEIKTLELFITVDAMESRIPVILEDGQVAPPAAGPMLSRWYTPKEFAPVQPKEARERPAKRRAEAGGMPGAAENAT